MSLVSNIEPLYLIAINTVKYIYFEGNVHGLCFSPEGSEFENLRPASSENQTVIQSPYIRGQSLRVPGGSGSQI